MRAKFGISVLITARLVATAAADPAISDASGQWFCLPDDAHHPQIQIDFIEGLCDQHICKVFYLLPVEQADDQVRIKFGGVGIFDASVDGSRYIETVELGSSRIINRGSCEFRSLDDLYIENMSTAERMKL